MDDSLIHIVMTRFHWKGDNTAAEIIINLIIQNIILLTKDGKEKMFRIGDFIFHLFFKQIEHI